MENNDIKKEFAKAFNWRKTGPYSHNEHKEPTWAEIFRQVGKLQERANRKDNSDKLNMLQDRIEYLEEELKNKTQ